MTISKMAIIIEQTVETNCGFHIIGRPTCWPTDTRRLTILILSNKVCLAIMQRNKFYIRLFFSYFSDKQDLSESSWYRILYFPDTTSE